MDPNHYCEDKLRRRAPEYHLALMFTPVAQRSTQQTLYALLTELREITQTVTDTQVAGNKLQWWRDEIRAAFVGQATHPASLALSKDAKIWQPHTALFMEFAEGIAMDLGHGGFTDIHDLLLYCYRTGAIPAMLSSIAGGGDQASLRLAQQLGTACRLVELLRDTTRLSSEGYFYLPADLIERHGVTGQDLHGPTTATPVAAAYRELGERAGGLFQSVQKEITQTQRTALHVPMLLARLRQQELKRIDKNQYHLLESRHALHPVARLWRLWRTARQLTR